MKLIYCGGLAVRASEKPLKISGYAYRFGDKGFADGMRETIQPGAFRGLDNVMLYLNHDPSMPLARSGQNMTLKEDSEGLRFEAELPETSLGRDVYELAKKGIIRGMSVGMREIEASEEGGMRTIRKASLEEVSLTQRPVYEKTSVEARSVKPNPILYPPECF